MPSLINHKKDILSELQRELEKIESMKSSLACEDGTKLRRDFDGPLKRFFKLRNSTTELKSYPENDEEEDKHWLNREENKACVCCLSIVAAPLVLTLTVAGLPIWITYWLGMSCHEDCQKAKEKEEFKQFKESLSEVDKITFNDKLFAQADKYIKEDVDFIKKHQVNKIYFDRKLETLALRIKQIQKKLEDAFPTEN